LTLKSSCFKCLKSSISKRVNSIGHIYIKLYIFFSDNEKQRSYIMRCVLIHLRFMTLSKIELQSIKPVLLKYMSEEEYLSVQFAIESGNSSLLPRHLSKSSNRRKLSSVAISAQPDEQESPPPDNEADDAPKNCILRSPQNSLRVMGNQPQESSNGLSPEQKMPPLDDFQIKAEADLCRQKVKMERFSGEIKPDKIGLKSEFIDNGQKIKRQKRKLQEEDELKEELSEEPEMKVSAKKRIKNETKVLLTEKKNMPDQEWDMEITENIVQVKKRVQPKEESSDEEQVSVASKGSFGRVKQEKSKDDKGVMKKSKKEENQTEPSTDQLWEFIETNGTMQVRRKHPKPTEEEPQVEIHEELQINNSNHKESPTKQTVRLTSLVHFELIQDCAQLTRSIHHVQSEAEKVIMNVKVLKDLQLLGVELSARTDDSKHSNKYKKTRFELNIFWFSNVMNNSFLFVSKSNEMYKEDLEVSVFSSELGVVFKSSVQGQRAYNARLVINASSMPVLPQGSKLRVKVTASKGAAYRTVSSIAFKGADAVLAKASVQHKELRNGDWVSVDRDGFCPITRLFLKVQN
jgi:hypothetical protein